MQFVTPLDQTDTVSSKKFFITQFKDFSRRAGLIEVEMIDQHFLVSTVTPDVAVKHDKCGTRNRVRDPEIVANPLDELRLPATQLADKRNNLVSAE